MTCIPCKTSRSLAHAEACFACPLNWYYSEEKKDCQRCQEHTIAFPGEIECHSSPECRVEFDAERIYSPCDGGKRRLSYVWKQDGACHPGAERLPAVEEVNCERCIQGTYRKDYLNGICEACPHGFFSSKVNAEKCTECPAGKFVSSAKICENMGDVETYCENFESFFKDSCAFTKGWDKGKDGFTIDPRIPMGVRVVLRKVANISEETGRLKFEYNVSEAYTENERFQYRVDGVLRGTRLIYRV